MTKGLKPRIFDMILYILSKTISELNLKLLKDNMKNIFYNFLIKIARFLLSFYWRLTKPLTIGVRSFVIDKEGNFLLVRHRGTNQWYLPGGQVKKKETLIEALRREVKEEVGVSIEDDSIGIFGCYSSFKEGKSDHIIVFIFKNFTMIDVSSIEIDTYSFFSNKNLPKNISPGTYRRICEYMKEIPISNEW